MTGQAIVNDGVFNQDFSSVSLNRVSEQEGTSVYRKPCANYRVLLKHYQLRTEASELKYDNDLSLVGPKSFVVN